MVAIKVVFELLTLLIAMFIVIILFFTFAKDVFPWLFEDTDINLAATKGEVSLQCNNDVHIFRINDLGIAYSGTKKKEGFLVLMWGNKVASSADKLVTLYPVGEGDNVYTAEYINFKFDQDNDPGDKITSYPIPGEGHKSELVLAIFEKNEYCQELASREEMHVADGMTKYSTDYSDFVNQCAGKLKGLGLIKTCKPILLECTGPPFRLDDCNPCKNNDDNCPQECDYSNDNDCPP